MKNTRKIFALTAAFCTLFLSSCKADENVPENVTAVPTETTSLTLTVALTEERPFIPQPEPEEDEEKSIELAVYDPFSDSVKVDDSVLEELSIAVETINDANGILYGDPTRFRIGSDYYDVYDYDIGVMEKNDELEYEFKPINAEFASDEKELFDLIRGIYTENYMSDDDIREILFTPESFDDQPLYKIIDGILCMKSQYRGVMTRIQNDNIKVLSYDESSAKIAAYGTGSAYPPSHVFMTLKKSDNGVWQLDEIEYKDYNEIESSLLYNAVYLNTEKLNKILGGGTTPDDPMTIEFNDETYVETELDMSIDEMNDFFRDIFFTYKLEIKFEQDEDHTDGLLLRKYSREYIANVYYELDGKLFRRADLPCWYLPEIEIDPYAGRMISTGGAMELFDGSGGFFIWEQPFKDESGESFTEKITVCYKNTEDNSGYEYVRIAGELPIREKTK